MLNGNGAKPLKLKSKILDSNLSGSSNELTKLEEKIQQGASQLANFVDIGEALLQIQERRLFTERGYTNFIVYCWDKFELSKARVYQLIKAIKALNSLSKIVEENDLSLSESHAVELAKIEDLDMRSQVLTKVAEGKITAGAIKREYQKMKLNAIAEKQKPLLPVCNTVVRLTTKTSEEYKRLNGNWGYVLSQSEYTVSVRILDCVVETIQPQFFVVLADANSDYAIALLNRLEAIYQSPEIDSSVKGVVKAIATKPYPLLTEWEDYLLNCIEQKLWKKKIQVKAELR